MIRRVWFLTLTFAVLLIVVAVLILVNLRVRSAASRLPERGRVTETVDGCPAQVDVRIDDRGIPHLTSRSEAALWFAQGYVHARERFFQMELARRAAAGRLAEVLGEQVLDNDRRMRVLRLAASARRQAAQMSASDRSALESYTAGVNAALQRFGKWIAPEVWLLGVDPEPWRTEDSLAIGLLMQLDLTWAMGEELRRAAELGRFGRDRAVDLWGWAPEEARLWIPPGEVVTSPIRRHRAIESPIGGVGSNSWVVAPKRSATGGALLANDPHLGVNMPGTFFAIHLRGPALHVAGASIAGMPGVFVGHTDHVAWSLNLSMLDDQDLFRLTVDEAGDRELVDGRWRSLRTVTEEIDVRWQESPVLLKIRLSDHGPVVFEQRDEVLALAWTAHYGQSPLQAVLKMNRATTVEDAATAWKEVMGPSMNLVAADSEGHILHQVVGRVPERGRGAGRLPAPGADSRWAWKGFRSPDTNPRRLDPENGFLASANHDLFVEGDYPTRGGFAGEFAPPWRVRRIRRALAARDDWTVDGFLELQGDVVSGRAIAILKLLRPELEEHGGLTAEALMAWGATMEVDSTAAHLYARMMLALQGAIGGDEASKEGHQSNPVGPEEVLRLLAGGLNEAWWDDVSRPGEQSRSEVLNSVLDRLDSEGFSDPWGAVHQISFDHPLATVPGLGGLAASSWSRGPFPISGDNVTVNAGYWRGLNPYKVTAAPALRLVCDVANWDETVLALPVGQSGRPWSGHYADQIEGWLRLEASPFPFSSAAVEESTVARLLLAPGGSTSRIEDSKR
jgi:penicillin amidase